jgi:hypothetical protein
MPNIYDVEIESGARISMFTDDTVINKMITGWKREYGDVLDLGGGTYDVSCHMIEEMCGGDFKELRRKFPALTLPEARLIAEQSHTSAIQDYY